MIEESSNITKISIIRKTYSKFLSGDEENASFALFAEAISERDFHSQQELSTFLGCNKAHTSRTILKMQLKGLIKLVSKNITLTDKGKEFAQKVRAKKEEIRQKLWQGVSETDQKIFDKVIDQIVANAKQLSGK